MRFLSIIIGLLVSGWIHGSTSSLLFNGPNLGINLAGLAYYTSSQPFLNVLKNTCCWSTQSGGGETNEEQYIPVDSNGYPTSMTCTKGGGCSYTFLEIFVLFSVGGGYNPAGTYDVFYDTRYTLAYGYNGSGSSANIAPGHDQVTIPSGGMSISITAISGSGAIATPMSMTRTTDTATYQNQCVAAANLVSCIQPAYLSYLAPMIGRRIRFMDWGSNNGTHENDQANYADLTPVSYVFWGGSAINVSGFKQNMNVPLPIMVALCNYFNANMWFTIPYGATDNLITGAANYISANLASNLNLYVEYGNETWSGGYGTTWLGYGGYTQWASGYTAWNVGTTYSIGQTVSYNRGAIIPQPGVGAGGTYTQIAVSQTNGNIGNTPVGGGGSDCDGNWCFPDLNIQGSYMSFQTAHIADLFKTAFGSRSSHVQGVLGNQTGDLGILQSRLQQVYWITDTLINHVQLIADTWYMGVEAGATVWQNWITQSDGGLSYFFQDMSYGGVSGGAVQPNYQSAIIAAISDRNYARTFSPLYQFVGYEGGPNQQYGTSSISSLSCAANVVTATTPAHGLNIASNPQITIANAAPSGYNGTYTSTITSTTQFTYPVGSCPGAETIPGNYVLPGIQAMLINAQTDLRYIFAINQAAQLWSAMGFGDFNYFADIDANDLPDGIWNLSQLVTQTTAPKYLAWSSWAKSHGAVAANGTGALDNVSNVVVAYSVRQLYSNYIGASFRAQCTSGVNAGQNIDEPFVAGWATGATSTAFCGSTAWTLVYWYDQSGNGEICVAAAGNVTFSSSGMGTNSRSLFHATSTGCSTVTYPMVAGYTALTVAKADSAAGSGTIFDSYRLPNQIAQFAVYSTTSFQSIARNTLNTGFTATQVTTPTNAHVLSVVTDNVGLTVQNWVDGSASSPVSITGTANSATAVPLDVWQQNGGSNPFSGSISEMIVIGTPNTALRSTLETNMRTAYGI